MIYDRVGDGEIFSYNFGPGRPRFHATLRSVNAAM